MYFSLNRMHDRIPTKSQTTNARIYLIHNIRSVLRI